MNLIDAAILLAACDTNADALRELCEDFQFYVPIRFAEVHRALESQDMPQLRDAAHKLCGLVSAFSTIVGNAASELEDSADFGRLDKAQVCAAQIETMVAELLKQTRDLSMDDLLRQRSQS